jgi:16S rRNA (guanine966-N2)-methyltransferase
MPSIKLKLRIGMRIIGGDAKRRSLKAPAAAHGARPILARIRKSLFDILRHRIPDAQLLDLYAGSGAVGIEALSRGAKNVTFVDQNHHCLNTIRQNLASLGMLGSARLLRMDASRALFTIAGPFDLIFMGPPYHDQKWNEFRLTVPTLKNIALANLLKPEGWVIGQHHKKEPVEPPKGWSMFRREAYGDTFLSFFMLDA